MNIKLKYPIGFSCIKCGHKRIGRDDNFIKGMCSCCYNERYTVCYKYHSIFITQDGTEVEVWNKSKRSIMFCERLPNNEVNGPMKLDLQDFLKKYPAAAKLMP